MNEITAVILTYNEEKNIDRCLHSLIGFVDDIVVIDSFSDDETLSIIDSFKSIRVFQRKFDSHTAQWNFGLSQVKTKWVLSLDADYIISEKLKEEIKNLFKSKIKKQAAYTIPFKYCINGKPLIGTILPPRHALFQKERSTYFQDGHTQMLKFEGKEGGLKSYILHDDRKPLNRWIWSQIRYMDLEAENIYQARFSELNMTDRFRKFILIAPVLVFIYCFIYKGIIFNGWRGLYYCLQRCFAELLLSIKLIEKKLQA